MLDLGYISTTFDISYTRHYWSLVSAAPCSTQSHITYLLTYSSCHYRVPTLLLIKNPGLSRTPMRKFPGPFRSQQMLKYKEKTLYSPPDPCPSSPSLPLEVGPFKSSSPSAGSGAKLQPKSNFVHFSLKIRYRVATILTILLRIN